MSDDRPVLVLGLMLAGLALGRGLGRIGLDVTGVALEGTELGLRSRYVRRRYTLTGETTAERDEQVLRVLRRLSAEGRRVVLLPERDEPVAFILRRWDEVRELADFPLPADPDAVWRLRRKERLLEEAAKAGVPAPTTVRPVEEQTLREAAIVPPFIVKPVERSEEFALAMGKKAILACTVEEGVRAARQATAKGFEVIAQEFIPHEPDGVVGLLAYIGSAGEPLATVVGRRVRQEPLRVGTSAVFETRDDPDVRELGLRLLRHVGYRGFAHVESALDLRDGVPKLLEVNTRTPIWVGIAINRHVDVSRIAYDDLRGVPPPRAAALPDGTCWTYLPKDLWASVQMARRRELGLRAFAAPYLRRQRSRAVFARDDPWPALGAASYYVEKLRARLS